MTVVGGWDASTGRRSRREAVMLERGFDGALRREPEVRQLAPRSSARSADERYRSPGPRLRRAFGGPKPVVARAPVQHPVRPVGVRATCWRLALHPGFSISTAGPSRRNPPTAPGERSSRGLSGLFVTAMDFLS